MAIPTKKTFLFGLLILFVALVLTAATQVKPYLRDFFSKPHGDPSTLYWKVSGLEFKENMSLSFDSLVIKTPQWEVLSTSAHLRLNPKFLDWGSDPHLYFQAKNLIVVQLDTTPKPPLESPEDLPEITKIRLPIKTQFSLETLELQKFIPNKPIVLHHLTLENPQASHLYIESDSINISKQNLTHKIGLSLIWNAFNDAKIKLRVRKNLDQAQIQGVIPAGKLRLGQFDGQGSIETLAPYMPQLPKFLHQAHHFQINLSANLQKNAFQSDLTFQWKPQLNDSHTENIQDLWEKISIHADFNPKYRNVSLHLLSIEGGNTQVKASQVSHSPKWPVWGKEAAQNNWDLSGSVENTYWTIANFQLPLNLKIQRGSWKYPKGVVYANTEANSKIEFHLTPKENSLFHFMTHVSSTEPWAHLWTNYQTGFQSARVEGRWNKNQLVLYSSMEVPKAYGFLGKKFNAYHRVDQFGYYTDSAFWFDDSGMLAIHGLVSWKKNAEGLKFNFKKINGGSGEVGMDYFKDLSIELNDFVPAVYSHQIVQAYHKFLPQVVNGKIFYDLTSKMGYTNLQGESGYSQELIHWNLATELDSTQLKINKITLNSEGNAISISGVCKFLEANSLESCWKNPLQTWQVISLAVPTLKLENVWGYLQKDILARGEISGGLQYHHLNGFSENLQVKLESLPWRSENFKVTQLDLSGEGDVLALNLTTRDDKIKILNDTLHFKLMDVLSKNPKYQVKVSAPSLNLSSTGEIRDSLGKGRFILKSSLNHKESWGEINQGIVEGDYFLPFKKGLSLPYLINAKIRSLNLITKSKDTLALYGNLISTQDSLSIYQLKAVNRQNQSIQGELGYQYKSKKARANLSTSVFAVNFDQDRWIRLKDVRIDVLGDPNSWEGNFNIDDGFAQWKLPSANFSTGISKTFLKLQKDSVQTQNRISVKGKIQLEDLQYKSKIISHEVTKLLGELASVISWSKNRRKNSIDSKKKPIPLELDLQVNTLGGNNIIDTDVLKANLIADLKITGTSPYVLLTGEINSLEGKLGLSSHTYELQDFSVNWKEDQIEDGRLYLVGEKTLADRCDEPKDSCTIQIILEGDLANPQFNYDGTCTGELGETVEPLNVITSVARGCFESDGNLGDAGRNALGSFVDQQVTKWVSQGAKNIFSGIDQVKVGGFGNFLKDSVATNTGQTGGEENAFSVQVSTRQYYRLRLQAQYRYFQGEEYNFPSELSGGIEWIPPLEKISNHPGWKYRVREKVKVETLLKSPTPNSTSNSAVRQNDLRFQAGLKYNYDFWEIW